MEKEIAEIKICVASIERTQSVMLSAMEAMHGTMKEILEGMAGDGSDELVAALRKLTESNIDLGNKIDALPDVLSDRIQEDL